MDVIPFDDENIVCRHLVAIAFDLKVSLALQKQKDLVRLVLMQFKIFA